MAVSQYLRPASLLDSVTSCFTQGAVKNASSEIGAPESQTRTALHSAAAAVLGGMVNVASNGEGARNLFVMIQQGGYKELVDDPASLFAVGSKTTSMMSEGRRVIDGLLGQRSTSVAETIANSSGLSASAAGAVLSLVAPLAMGVVEKEILFRELNEAGLQRILLDEKGELEAALPPRIPQIVPTRQERVAPRSESKLEASLGKWLVVWVVILFAVSVFLFMRSGTVAGGAPVNTNPASQGMTAPNSR